MATEQEQKNGSKPTPKKNETAKSKSQKISFLSLFALVLGLIALGGSVYSIHSLHSMERTINTEVDVANRSIADLVEQQTSVLAGVRNINALVHANKNALQADMQNLETKLNRKLRHKGNVSLDWQLLKAQYFLEMAQINAHWQQEPKITKAMLEQADTLLEPIGGNAVIHIRKALADEIMQLQNAQPLDIVGLLGKIDGIRNQVQGFTIKTPQLKVQKSEQDADSKPEKKSWKERWASSVHLLEKLVVIRHHHDKQATANTPAQKEIAKESIDLALQQAQWAIMQKNQQVYTHALREALAQLQRLQPRPEPQIKTIENSILTLLPIPLKSATPIPEKGLHLINQLIDSGAKLTTTTNAPGTESKDDAQ